MPLAQPPFRPRSFAKKPILHHAVFHKHLSDGGCVGDKSAETQRRNQPSLTEAASPTQALCWEEVGSCLSSRDTASTREWTPSLLRRLFTWLRTVVGKIPRSTATSSVEWPTASRRRTSSSRGVRTSSPVRSSCPRASALKDGTVCILVSRPSSVATCWICLIRARRDSSVVFGHLIAKDEERVMRSISGSGIGVSGIGRSSNRGPRPTAIHAP
jgi:hypothetical protein